MHRLNRNLVVLTCLILALISVASSWLSGCRGPAMYGVAPRESTSHDPSRSVPSAQLENLFHADGTLRESLVHGTPEHHLRVPGRYRQPATSAIANSRAAAPTGSLPALDEEVWVIVKPDTTTAPAPVPASDDFPGCGGIICRIPDGQNGDQTKDVPLPLKHTEVRSSISAYIASVEVTQQFHNPYDSKIEAVYVFPLPQNAAVNGFVMIIGERKIRGIIREREEATRIYQQARAQGHVASLLTQERPNIFTQHVANIEPGKQVDVNITYFHTLAYDDGWYEYTFPMVVGPRFNPPGFSDGVGAVAHGSPSNTSGQKTEIQYLRPNERSGHDIALTLNIEAGVPIEQIICRSHRIEVSHESSSQARIELAQDDRIPNKDFVLRYRVAGEQAKTALLTHRDQSSGDGYFTFLLVPPAQLTDSDPRQPMEMIFVIDCSGSMSGQPIKQAKAAVDSALNRLQPGDTFQIIQFSNSASQLGPRPLPVTPENVRIGRDYVRNLRGEGGTMMIEGIKAALDFPHDQERLRFVTFLTDGYIGNESQILSEVHKRIGAARIFSFGVGSSPNRFLMDRMAKFGRGAVAYLGLNDDGADVMERFLSRVSHPVLTDIQVDFGSMQAHGVTPSQVPDLFVGRPVVISGRFNGALPDSIRVTGRNGDHTVQTMIAVNDDDAATAHPALASVWARMQIAELMDQAAYNPDIELPQAVKAIALQHSLMSAYTSFVAVDSLTQTAGDHGTTVHVAVPVPHGVRYETTVQE